MSTVRFIKRFWMKIRKSFVVKLLKILAVIVISLLIVEMGLRLWGYILLRSKTPDVEKIDISEADYFIACFGDSLTEGARASSPSLSYPSQLKRILNSRYPDKKVFVLNRGRSGSNSSELIRYMTTQLPISRPPDLVIVTTFHNNYWNFRYMPEITVANATPPTDKRLIGAIEQAKVGKLAVILKEQGRELFNRLKKEDPQFNDPNVSEYRLRHMLPHLPPEERAFFDEWVKTDMLKIEELVKSRGSKVLFVIYHMSPLNESIRDSATSLSLPFCEAPKDGERWRALDLLSKDHWHPNDKGYAVFAEHIADCMEKHGFVPEKR